MEGDTSERQMKIEFFERYHRYGATFVLDQIILVFIPFEYICEVYALASREGVAKGLGGQPCRGEREGGIGGGQWGMWALQSVVLKLLFKSLRSGL